ncbi:hypothetical protein MTO96_033988 [Rhipicephalus appendiculatus]
MVVREGLRLYPALPVMILRECAQDTTVLGQFIPRGTTLVAPPWHIHRDPNIWQNPDEFIPDRFANQSALSSTYFPFGLGSHVCLGQRLAMLMMKTVLYKTICEFELSLNAEDSGPLKLKVPGLLLNPVGALRVNFKPSTTMFAVVCFINDPDKPLHVIHVDDIENFEPQDTSDYDNHSVYNAYWQDLVDDSNSGLYKTQVLMLAESESDAREKMQAKRVVIPKIPMQETSVSMRMSTILDHIGEGSRCLVEGDLVLEAGHVIECSAVAATCRSGGPVHIIAYVLQSSGLHNDPHKVELKLQGEDTIQDIKCTCPAGVSELLDSCDSDADDAIAAAFLFDPPPRRPVAEHDGQAQHLALQYRDEG